MSLQKDSKITRGEKIHILETGKALEDFGLVEEDLGTEMISIEEIGQGSSVEVMRSLHSI